MSAEHRGDSPCRAGARPPPESEPECPAGARPTPESELQDEPATAWAFGRWLLQERELRGLARDEVVKLTRLSPPLVAALESGDPDRMPPKAYVFGYLRTYARVVGLDADDVVLRWQEVVGPEESVVGPHRRPPSKATVLIALGIALALVALVLTLLGPRRGRAPLQLRKPPAVERAPYPSSGR